MIKHITIETRFRNQMINITRQITEIVKDSGIVSGICILNVPHTTASITLNENEDPNTQNDLLSFLSKLVPDDVLYTHKAGNGDSHIKATIVGNTVTLIIEDNEILLGTWQGIFFCEFDGPRNRQLLIKLIRE